MGTKFTTGPYYRGCNYVVGIRDGLQIWSACVYPFKPAVETAELEAVATLFQAAPDLYAALKAVEWLSADTKGLVKVCPICGNVEQQGHAPDCIINNALLKAEGGQHDSWRRERSRFG